MMHTSWYEVILGIKKEEAVDLVYTTDLTDEEKKFYRHLSSLYPSVTGKSYTYEIPHDS